eukprot:TRINITY_DN6797_c0_g1_i7.p1 TRINITY_DN6797_c0_g1~~TRINITY_DN6797_c0_g1_i7.p1  ORF type:complete len:350 (-),score=155.47 TRINITY_DN6797_c0_g1_i7:289-1338(-)
MKKVSSKGKLLSLVLAGCKDRSVLRTKTASHLKYDTPIVLQFNEGKDDWYVCDAEHKMACKFTEQALFWFKLNNKNMAVTKLDKKYIFLSEYTFEFKLVGKSQVKVHLVICSFSLLEPKEAKEYDFSFKKAKEVTKEEKLEAHLDDLRKSLQRKGLSKKISEMPDLEAILTNTEAKPHKRKPSAKADSDMEEEEDQIIGFQGQGKMEKALEKDVKILLDHEAKLRGKVQAGSEGNLERDRWLSKVVDRLKNERLVSFLKDHGTVDRLRDPAKSPVKRGKMPKDMKEIVEEIKRVNAGKRKKADGGRSSSSKPRKKTAVEGKGKKAVAVRARRASNPRKSSRSMSKGRSK